MTSYTLDMSDVWRMLSSQSHQATSVSSISYFLSIVVVILLAILLLRSKQANIYCLSYFLFPSPGGRAGDVSREPPGPWGNLPLLGYLPWLGSKSYVTMWNLARRYGSVYQIRFGCRKVVILNGLEAIRLAFVRQSDTFAGRPDFSSFALFSDGLSLGFTTLNHDWVVQRKVLMRALSIFTSGSKKYHVEAMIHREAAALADRVLHDSAPAGDGLPSTAVDPFGAIESAVLAIVFEVSFGVAGDGDELYSHMMQMLRGMRDVMPMVQTVDVIPWLRSFCRRHLQRYADSLRRLDQLATSKVDELVNAGVPEDPVCIVHALHNACLAEKVDDSSRIPASVQDVIGASSDVVVHFIYWVILYATKYRSIVQDGVREEIQRTIGWSSVPLGVDRNRMPYTEACMWEIVRHSCVTPMSLPHATLCDTVVSGCTIRANTIVFANFYSTGWDPEIWGDPAVFRPQRFLTTDGQLDRAIVDRFLTFGLGRRRCPGAQLARLFMFVFFVVLMQKCTFIVPPGHELSIDGDFVLSNKAKKYSVLVQTTAAAWNANL